MSTRSNNCGALSENRVLARVASGHCETAGLCRTTDARSRSPDGCDGRNGLPGPVYECGRTRARGGAARRRGGDPRPGIRDGNSWQGRPSRAATAPRRHGKATIERRHEGPRAASRRGRCREQRLGLGKARRSLCELRAIRQCGRGFSQGDRERRPQIPRGRQAPSRHCLSACGPIRAGQNHAQLSLRVPTAFRIWRACGCCRAARNETFRGERPGRNPGRRLRVAPGNSYIPFPGRKAHDRHDQDRAPRNSSPDWRSAPRGWGCRKRPVPPNTTSMWFCRSPAARPLSARARKTC